MSPINLQDELQDRCAHCVGRSRSICNAIAECDLPILAAESFRMTIPAGRCFIEEGRTPHDFFIVTSGRARLFTLLSDGRRQITGFAEIGDFLGLAAVDSYAFSAEALGPVTLCRFPHATMERLTARFPHLEHRLRLEASRELALMQARLTLLGRKTAPERLATFLLERCRETQRRTSRVVPCVEIDLPMPRSDIADYLGLTIETVSRTFSLFRRAKLITISSITHITLLDPTRIAAIAEGAN